MALTSPALYQAFQMNRASGVFAFLGTPYDQLALGIANGIMQWGIGNPVNLRVTGKASGGSGVGVILPATSSIVVPPNTGLVVSGLSGAGISGPLSSSLAAAVAMGVSQSFTNSAQYSGTSAAVGAGQDISKITIANASTLIGILNITLRASLGNGSALSMMASGLGIGIASLLMTGTGTATIIPSPGSPASAAPTIGATSSMVV